MADRPDIVVAGYVRTPFGRFGGGLSSLTAAEIGARTIDALVERTGIQPEHIDAVYGGVGMISAGTLTPVRQAVIQSKLPVSTPSMSIDRACCSGMTAVGVAYKDLMLGEGRAIICGGFESLSRTPRLTPRRPPLRPEAMVSEDPLLLSAPVVERQIAVYTGEEALRAGISRELQDAWALASHARFNEAEARGFFADERVPIALTDPRGQPTFVSTDESPRQDSTLAKLASLAPIYAGATVTAGNAPGLNDGGAFLLLMTAGAAAEAGLEPLARIAGYTQVAAGPTSGTSTPAFAIARLMQKGRPAVDQFERIEINEAYAATPLVSTLVLADRYASEAEALRAICNVNGGAVAIGHPLGASGARIVMTLIAGLRERGGGRGVAAICGGFGQGDAILIEVGE